jgi:hypothetical protein
MNIRTSVVIPNSSSYSDGMTKEFDRQVDSSGGHRSLKCRNDSCLLICTQK